MSNAVTAYAATSATEPLSKITIDRRDVGPRDVEAPDGPLACFGNRGGGLVHCGRDPCGVAPQAAGPAGSLRDAVSARRCGGLYGVGLGPGDDDVGGERHRPRLLPKLAGQTFRAVGPRERRGHPRLSC